MAYFKRAEFWHRTAGFNDQRLLGPIGDIPPTDFEHLYDCRQRSSLSEAGLN